MKFICSLSVAFVMLPLLKGHAQEPRIISECTVVYQLTVGDAKADSSLQQSMAGTTKTLYLKGSKSRIDLQSPTFLQSTISDSKSDTTVILKELGNAKYLSFLNEQKRKEQNSRFEGITFTATTDSKVILGYECVRIEGKLTDGTTYNVYYTNMIIPSNKEYEYQFRSLPGFVLEYETLDVNHKTRIKCTAIKINLNPVQRARFDIPNSGYRIL